MTGVSLSASIGGTDANGFDAIADAIRDVQANAHVDPDAVFIHPTDWWTLGSRSRRPPATITRADRSRPRRAIRRVSVP